MADGTMPPSAPQTPTGDVWRDRVLQDLSRLQAQVDRMLEALETHAAGVTRMVAPLNERLTTRELALDLDPAHGPRLEPARAERAKALVPVTRQPPPAPAKRVIKAAEAPAYLAVMRNLLAKLKADDPQRAVVERNIATIEKAFPVVTKPKPKPPADTTADCRLQ
ncbi:MAG TPA: hypothetical protein VL985_05240 [Stellaceae bacterium]|nr:hypothetical protein [Stellaceae bacterium]